MHKYYIIILFIIYLPLTLFSQKKSWIEEWQKSTISIGIVDTIKKQPIYLNIGTGVIFGINYNDSFIIPCIITAKHVFEDSSQKWTPNRIRIKFSWANERRIDEYFGIEIKLSDSNETYWYKHPNSDIDLACLPITHFSVLNISDFENHKSMPILPNSMFSSSNEIFEGAPILVFGYPGAVGLEFSNKALTRSGIIAWLSPHSPLKSKILIDCNIFPGNSGGPVFRTIGLMDKYGNKTLGGNSISFLGIVSQRRFSDVTPYWSLSKRPVISTKGEKLLSYESIGIGVVEPVSRVKELLDFVQKEILKN